jgi:hypothetical protein
MQKMRLLMNNRKIIDAAKDTLGFNESAISALKMMFRFLYATLIALSLLIPVVILLIYFDTI